MGFCVLSWLCEIVLMVVSFLGLLSCHLAEKERNGFPFCFMFCFVLFCLYVIVFVSLCSGCSAMCWSFIHDCGLS